MENDGIEKRLQDLEERVQELEWEANRNRPLGPGHAEKGLDPEVVERLVNSAKEAIRDAESEIPPVDRSKRCMLSGNPETPEHREIVPSTGMQKDYVVLCPDERAKGFVRPVRRTYLHIGKPGPKFPLLDMTHEQRECYSKYGYVKFEQYPPEMSPSIGRYWTQEDLDKINKGCGTTTTMGLALAETYARDPKFYSGTFCCHCRTHFDVDEFVWGGTQERLGT